MGERTLKGSPGFSFQFSREDRQRGIQLQCQLGINPLSPQGFVDISLYFFFHMYPKSLPSWRRDRSEKIKNMASTFRHSLCTSVLT